MSLTVLRKFIPADRPHGVRVPLAGKGTAWTAATTFTLSGVTPPPTVATKVVNSATDALLVIATGDVATTQVLTISDGVSSATVPVEPVGPARGRWFPGLAR